VIDAYRIAIQSEFRLDLEGLVTMMIHPIQHRSQLSSMAIKIYETDCKLSPCGCMPLRLAKFKDPENQTLTNQINFII